MIPESLGTFYAFLGLVAPGIVYQLITERVRPVATESALREASLVALTSLVFTTSSVIILGLISLGQPAWFVDMSAWSRRPGAYVADNLWLVVTSIAIEVALACGLAALTAWLLSLRPTAATTPIAKTGVWYQALKGDKPKDKASWVLAELIDGTRIWGYVHYFTIEDTGDDRDISFKGPGLTVQRPNEDNAESETYYKYFVVRSSQIRLLKVAHEKKA